jgi:hypothetical protein
MPQNLMKEEPRSLEKSPNSEWKLYLDVVETILEDYWFCSNRAPLEKESWTKTVNIWGRHLYTNNIPIDKLTQVYERALRMSEYLTVSVMLMAWDSIQEELTSKRSLREQLSGDNCSICKGTGVAINFNFDTQQDEEVTCVCGVGQRTV